MELLAQFLINGLALGGVYALLALGFAIIYNTVRIFHVLHGAVYVVSGYITHFFMMGLGLPLAVSAVLAVVSAVLMGIIIELVVYRPLRGRAGFLTLFLASLAGMFFVQGLLLAVFSTVLRTLKTGPLDTIHLGNVTIAKYHIFIIVLILALFTLATLFFKYTKWGRVIRAVASNSDLAVSVGINPSHVYLLVFGLGSGLAGIAGIARAYDIGLEPVVGLPLVILAAISVIVGGIGSLPGAALGGMLLGLAQTLAALLFSGQWSQAVALVMLLLFIVFRPYGLLGSSEHRELRRLL